MLNPIFIVMTGICLLGSSCIMVANHWSLPIEYYQNGDYKPLIMVEVDTGSGSVGVPYVLEYSGDRVPFGLKVKYITHNVVSHPTLHIESATIRLDDGTIIEIGGQIQSQLILTPEQHSYIDDDHQDKTKPGLRGETTVAGCIPKKIPFTLHMKGRMMSRGTTIERFDAKLRFSPDTELDVYNRVFTE